MEDKNPVVTLYWIVKRLNGSIEIHECQAVETARQFAHLNGARAFPGHHSVWRKERSGNPTPPLFRERAGALEAHIEKLKTSIPWLQKQLSEAKDELAVVTGILSERPR